MRKDISITSHYFYFLSIQNSIQDNGYSTRNDNTIEKNICNSVGRVLKRLLPFNPTPAAIEIAAIRKLCSLCSKSTRAKIASLVEKQNQT